MDKAIVDAEAVTIRPIAAPTVGNDEDAPVSVVDRTGQCDFRRSHRRHCGKRGEDKFAVLHVSLSGLTKNKACQRGPGCTPDDADVGARAKKSVTEGLLAGRSLMAFARLLRRNLEPFGGMFVVVVPDALCPSPPSLVEAVWQEAPARPGFLYVELVPF